MIHQAKKKQFNFAEADVVLHDPNMRMRTLMRGVLLTIGFREIKECRTAKEAEHIIKLNPVDLLIVDLDSEPDQICRIVREIREGAVGANPYIVIIGLTWKAEKEMISRSLRTGLDDLIAKPISPKILSERTKNLILNRKKFVVTTSYIGPDRRGEERRIEGDLDTLKVPNSLRFKATGDKAAVADTQALDTMQRHVNMQRIYRLAKELADQCENLENEFAASENGQTPSWNYRETAEKINWIKRIIEVENIEILAPISKSMQSIVKVMYRSEQASAQHFSILRLHGEAIGEAIKDEDAAAELITEALRQTMKFKRPGKPKPARKTAA